MTTARSARIAIAFSFIIWGWSQNVLAGETNRVELFDTAVHLSTELERSSISTTEDAGAPAGVETGAKASSVAEGEGSLHATFNQSDAVLETRPGPILQRAVLTEPVEGAADRLRRATVSFFSGFDITRPLPESQKPGGGPRPASLPLDEQPRVKSASAPYKSPIILLSGTEAGAEIVRE